MSGRGQWELGGPIGDGLPYYVHAQRLRRVHGSGPLPQGGRPMPDVPADEEEPPPRRTLDPAGIAELVKKLDRTAVHWPPDREALSALDDRIRQLDVSGARDELAAGIREIDHVPADRLRLLG